MVEIDWNSIHIQDCNRGGRRDWCPLRQPDFPRSTAQGILSRWSPIQISWTSKQSLFILTAWLLITCIGDITCPRVDMNLSSSGQDKTHIHKRVVYYINTSEIPNQLTFKGTIYHVTITTVISSRVKIWSSRGKAHLIFHWCLYNKNTYVIHWWDWEPRLVFTWEFVSRHRWAFSLSLSS